jgi:cobalt-zinc-cadmium efflux system protein
VRHGRYYAALGVSLVVAAVEVYGGIRSQSIGLIADAMHAGTDALAIAITVVALHTRRELRGAAINGALLLAITGAIAWFAVQRLLHPLHPQGAFMAAISAFALAGNLCAGYLLLHGAQQSINARAAFLHVAGDAMGSFAVLVAGLLVLWTHRAWLDPAFSLVVCAIVAGGIALLLQEARSMLEKKPAS